MNNTSDLEPDELATALVAAFPLYVQQRLDVLDVDIDSPIVAAVDVAAAELADSLEALARLSPQEQVKSPLELVRDATRPITALLDERRVAAPHRDEWAVEIHPEDVYDLYPASSRDLGEEAWQLHLAWGIDKARVVAGVIPAPLPSSSPSGSGLPAVALFGIASEERGDLIEELKARGYRGLIWRNPAALAVAAEDRPQLVIVDLRHPTAHDAVRSLVASGIRVVAVADRVDDFAMAGVIALGAEEALELRRVVGRLDGLLPRLA